MGGVVSSTSRMRVLASFILASSVVYTVRCLSEDELLLLSPEELCKDRLSEEYFRLKADYDGGDCRDVVRCDRAGAAGTIRLAAVRCPAGLAFDIFRQTCDWKAKVDNCDQLSKPRKALPNLNTNEPVCPQDELQCGNGQCIAKALFCDDQVDCSDGSDETACDVNQDPNRAPECDTATCQLPDCFCSPDGTRIPGNINPDQVPQMITITFNGAINSDISIFIRTFSMGRDRIPTAVRSRALSSHPTDTQTTPPCRNCTGKVMRSPCSPSLTRTTPTTGAREATTTGWPRWPGP